MDDGIIHTSDFYIDHTGQSDSGPGLQAFLNAIVDTKKRGWIDPGIIDCKGCDVYLNSTGTRDGLGVNGLRVEGSSRNQSRVVNARLHVGDQNNLTSGASGKLTFASFSIEGQLNLYNCESTPILQDMTIFPSAIDGFYAGIDTILVQLIYCNHPLLVGVRIENGIDVSAEADGIRFSGCNNATWIGGGVSKCRQGIAFEHHPRFGGGVCRMAKLDGLHLERNRLESILLDEVSNAMVRCHVRGSPPKNGDPGWDTTRALIKLLGKAEMVTLDLYCVGVSHDKGTAVQVNDCNHVYIRGTFEDFETAVEIANNVTYNIGTINASRVGQPLSISPGAVRTDHW
ncbi:MAG: hypothetical protein ACRECX_00570 [Methyloceanibacter sp.]|uniref:hypothetical protein n=1 Tax=Methyloceanibacter sp. TaxID=1965321 RepID=UPI003D6D0AF7